MPNQCETNNSDLVTIINRVLIHAISSSTVYIWQSFMYQVTMDLWYCVISLWRWLLCNLFSKIITVLFVFSKLITVLFLFKTITVLFLCNDDNCVISLWRWFLCYFFVKMNTVLFLFKMITVLFPCKDIYCVMSMFRWSTTD